MEKILEIDIYVYHFYMDFHNIRTPCFVSGNYTSQCPKKQTKITIQKSSNHVFAVKWDLKNLLHREKALELKNSLEGNEKNSDELQEQTNVSEGNDIDNNEETFTGTQKGDDFQYLNIDFYKNAESII